MVRHTRSSAKKQASKEADSNNKQESSEASASNKDASKDQNSPRLSEDSSSESDIENYLKPVNEIDLTSSFFDIPKPEKQFQDIEKNIFSGVRKLSDSESEDDLVLDNKEKEAAMEIQKATVEKIQDYMKRIEEAKQHVEEYEAKKQSQKKKTRKKLKTDEAPNIADLLSVGEKLSKDETNSASLGSEDFTSMSESEREDWEEVKEAKEKNIIPKETVQITVQMPGVIRQKKGLDLIAAMKRRLNRIKKENQVLIHKVHLLCWIAHGNHVNVTINDEKLMGLALSLIPSEHCYPSDRTDLNYLEQILSWYRKTMQHLDQREDKNFDIKRQLHIDMSKKQASNKKILVYIFICILRSLGIHCRLVMSLLVEPLRPPSSELCSLSTKKEVKKNAEKETTKEENETKLNDYTKEAVRGSKRKTSDKVKEEKAKNVNKKESADHKKQVKPSERKTGNKKEEIAKSPDKKVPKRESQTETMQALKKKSVPEKKPNTSSQNKEKHESKKPIQQSAKANTNKQNKEKGKTANKTKPNLLKIKMLRLNKPSKTSESKDVQTTSQQVPQLDGANDSADEASTSAKKPNLKKIKEKKVEPDCPHRTHVRRLKSLPQYTEGDSEEEFAPRSPFSRKNSQDKKIDLSKLSVKRKSVRFSLKRSTSASPRKMDVRDDIINLVKGRISEQKEKDKMKLVKNRKVRQDDDDDSDYSPEPIKKKKHESDDEFIESLKPKVKKRVQVKQENDEVEKKRRGNDVWIEVYLETEEKWISVDVVRQQVHCVNEIFKRASQPVCYILAWDNKNYIKDITSRYCPNWNTVTRKLRVDPKWWEQTLKAFAGPKSARDREEDEELARLQLEKPLPTTISEYKNHPLYALKRHLLKFEAIYPPDAVTLGFVRNEPVYSRECVHTLHSREIWLKHAKVVRPGEKPYKIVKARPKYDRLSNTFVTDQLLEIFGSWQVDDYVPPTAENGIVPRNEYGNVELFKACMLPKGTVHLQLPGLNKVAKKLNIDCAPAMVGFEFHSGWTHPMFDGFVVCEEYKDTLIAAWTQEQEEAEKRAQEKIEKRVYDNWRRLIKGLLIRERLKKKYDFGETSTATGGKQKRKGKGPTVVVKKRRRVCSNSESDKE